MKTLIICLIATGSILSACVKEPLQTPPVSIQDQVIPQSFDWSMVQSVTVNVTGLNTPVPITNSLQVANESGNFYLRKLALMSDTLSLTISVPKAVSTLVVSYGTISKTLNIVQGTVSFDYLTELSQ